jgi:hypothetical protein
MILGGAAVGLAAKRLVAKRRATAGDVAMSRFTAYFIVPVWIGAGFLDMIWHRRMHIETTSGLEESLSHTLMMVEAAPAVLAPLLLEINSGVLAGMLGLAILHEATVLWDLRYTNPRRPTPAGEQITHTFLEAPPFLTAAAAVATHWGDFLALFGRGRRRRVMRIRFRWAPIPVSHMLAIFAAMAVFGGVPHADELRRCIQAKRAGRDGQDSPECLAAVYQN